MDYAGATGRQRANGSCAALFAVVEELTPLSIN
jgi:hypothetical protein